jgi:hypothetical protein
MVGGLLRTRRGSAVAAAPANGVWGDLPEVALDRLKAQRLAAVRGWIVSISRALAGTRDRYEVNISL